MTICEICGNAASQPADEILPVNFVVLRPTLLLRTAEGTKLMSVIIKPTRCGRS